MDVAEWHRGFAVSWSSHHVSYGQGSIPSITRALRHLADAYPDPTTGKNTAISSALQLQFVHAIVLHSTEAQKPTVAIAR